MLCVLGERIGNSPCSAPASSGIRAGQVLGMGVGGCDSS